MRTHIEADYKPPWEADIQIYIDNATGEAIKKSMIDPARKRKFIKNLVISMHCNTMKGFETLSIDEKLKTSSDAEGVP